MVLAYVGRELGGGNWRMMAASLENGLGACWQRRLPASLEAEEGCCCAPSMLVRLGAQGVEAVCGGKFVDVASG